MREKYIENAICQKVSMMGGFAFKGPNHVPGFPDRVVLYKGRVGFLEVKAPGGRLTNLQEYWIKKLIEMGYKAAVVYSIDEGVDFVKRI